MRTKTRCFRNITILVVICLCFAIYSPVAMGKTGELAIRDEDKHDELSASLERIEANLAPLHLAVATG
jgi:hypothetical protein